MAAQSLKELSDSIDAVVKKYDIKTYVEEFRSSILDINKDAHQRMESLNDSDMTNGNQFDKIMGISNSLSDQDLEKIVKVSKRLNRKYKVDKFNEECEKIRTEFLSTRSNYFSIKAITGAGSHGPEMLNTYVDFSGVSDLMLAKWMDKVLERIYPYCLNIKYEDLEGKLVETRISYRDPVITPDYVECPLISRYHGWSSYDRFVLHSFFDAAHGKWVYVPLRLIIDLTSPEGINIYDIDIATE
jgi:hypothetical protein